MSQKTLSAVYFSPTGTTRRTVRNIASGIALPLVEFDRTLIPDRRNACHFTRNDLAIIALPVFGGRLPRIADEFFAGITAEQTPAAIAVLYGNRHYDDALIELKHAAEAAGFKCVAAGAFIGEHSYTCQVAANRPDADDARVEADFGRRFVEKAQMSESSLRASTKPLAVPGEFPSAKPVMNTGITPVTSEDCVNCQTCVDGCPTGAINRQNPREVDSAKCITCCYCIKACPKGARRLADPRALAAINRLQTLFTVRREAEIFF